MFDDYSVATGSVDITPRDRIPLAGYATLRKPVFDQVADPLEANIVVLRERSDTLVFIALDLMYVGAYLRDRLIKTLSPRVPGEAIFMAAAHTHFAPPTEDSLPVLGRVTPAYRDFVGQRVSELAVRLLEGPFVPVSLEYLEGVAKYSVNRRKRAFGISRAFPYLGSRVRIKPNVSARRDDVIRMIRIRDTDSRDVAACWSYACHPVGFPLLNDVSAEYPGFVRSMIRATLGDVPVVFWQGFSGNIGPLRTVRRAGAVSSLPHYAFTAATLPDWNDWARGLGQCVVDTARGPGRPIRGPSSRSVRVLPLGELGLSSRKELCLQEIRLGRDLVICGLNGEIAVEYVDALRKLHAPADVIPVGCVGDVFGYLPVDTMVHEGGYEAKGFVRRFGLRGRFAPNVSELVTERLLRYPPATGPSQTQGGTAGEHSADVVERGREGRTPAGTIDV